jgi:hypothetical protein
MREREMAMEDDSSSRSVGGLSTGRPRSAKAAPSTMQRKQAAADRIGIGRGPR